MSNVVFPHSLQLGAHYMQTLLFKNDPFSQAVQLLKPEPSHYLQVESHFSQTLKLTFSKVPLEQFPLSTH